MTIAEWRADPHLFSALAEQMKLPIWQAALNVLETESYAQLMHGSPVNVITGNGDALAGKILGYEHALYLLRSLAELPDQPVKPIVETYGVSPEQATE